MKEKNCTGKLTLQHWMDLPAYSFKIIYFFFNINVHVKKSVQTNDQIQETHVLLVCEAMHVAFHSNFAGYIVPAL